MVITDVFTVASVTKEGYVHIREWIDEKKDIKTFDAYQQRFIEVLERALQTQLQTDINGEQLLACYQDRRTDILEHLGETQFGDQEEAVANLCDTMTEVLAEELHEYDIDKNALRRAVEAAYKAALTEMIQGEKDKTKRLLAEMARDIQLDVDEINETLTEIEKHLKDRPELVGRQERYRLLYPTDNDWKDELALELGVQTDQQQFPYLAPDVYEQLTDSENKRLLLAGRKGAGKSRTLVEAVIDLEEDTELSKIVVVTEKMSKTEDLAKAFQEVNGDVLLVFDDLQKSVANDGLDFGDALTEIEQRLGNNDLYVRATTRSENLDDVLPDGLSLDRLTGRRDRGAQHEQWTTLEGVHLPTLEGDRLEKFVEQSLAFYELEVNDDVCDAFIEAVTETDPTPFYIVSVCVNAGTRLTHHDINKLPPEAVDSWKRAYATLEEDDALKQWLEALVVVDSLDISPRESVVNCIFSHLSDGRASTASKRAQQLGWTAMKSGRTGTQVAIHDVQLEAIDFDLRDELEKGAYLDFSDFLLDNRRVERLPDDLGALLNANFAKYVFEYQLDMRPVEDAERHFEHAVELVCESPEVHLSYAEFLEQRGEPTEVVGDQYEAAMEKTPGDPSIYLDYCSFLIQKNQVEYAIQLYEKGLKQNPGDTLLRRNFANLLENHGKVDEAVELYKDDLENILGNEWCCSHFTQLLIKCGREDEAIEVFEEGLEQNPESVWLYKDFSDFLQQRGEENEAIQVSKKRIKQNPKQQSPYAELAELLKKQGREDEAIQVYKECLEQVPRYSRIQMDLAELLKKQGRENEAVALYEKSLKQEPESQWFHQDFAIVLEKEGKEDEAIEMYKKGIKQNPQVISYYANLAFLLNKRGRDHEAIEVFEEGLEQNPGDTDLIDGFSWLLNEQGKENEAIEIVKKGIEQNPQEKSLREDLARLLERQGREAEAVEVYQNMLDYTPGDTKLRRRFINLLNKQGMVTEAIAVYEESLENTPGDMRLRMDFVKHLAKKGDITRATELYGKSTPAEGEELREEFAEFLEESDLPERAAYVREQTME